MPMTETIRPVVQTESGRVRGILEDGIAAFRGIPYAASPVGQLRFAAPQRHPMWSGVRDAAHAGPSVPQGPSRLEAVMGRRVPDWNEEGCLTVNVWTPQRRDGGVENGGVENDGTENDGTENEGADRRELPVLVWFHGGGFTSGSGGWDWYDGRNLAAAGDIVVVTANYRLGPFGYLYLPHLGIENLGVRDQQEVLGWVTRNIRAFGGDPGRLTVGGQSAGAFSALHLATSSETGSSIARIIAQSAPLSLAPQNPQEATDRAQRFLEILELGVGPDLLARLRAAPAEALLSAYGRLARETFRPGYVDPPMFPVLGAPGIPSPWQQALADGCFDGKDLLAGTTADEMSAFFARDPAIQSLTADQARSIVAGQVEDGANRYDRVAARRPGIPPSDTLTEVETEIVFGDGTLAIADHQAAARHPAYLYRFDRVPAEDPLRFGAPHCCDLPFFFDNLAVYPDSPMLGTPTAEDRQLAKALAHAAATFVSSGRPDDDAWPAYAPDDPTTLRRFG
jgi:para-nitrobenzyl esterase